MIYKDWSDEKTRDQIISEEGLSQNVFLSAGAGSGKTSSLVNRVMGFIDQGVPMASIVAITFTREAAKMFYGRITKELENRIRRAPDSGSQKLYQQALSQLDLAFFGTIDSFCRKLLMEHPAESGVPLDMVPLERASEKTAIVEEILGEMWQQQKPVAAYDKAMQLIELEFTPDQLTRMLQYAMEEDTFTIELPAPPSFRFSGDVLAYLEKARELAEGLKEYYDRTILPGNNEMQRKDMTTIASVEAYGKAWRYSQREHPVNGLLFLDKMVEVFSYAERKGKAKKPEQQLERAGDWLEDSRKDEILAAYGEKKYYEALSWIGTMQEAYLQKCWEKSQISYQRSLCLLVEMLEREGESGPLLAYIRNKYRYYLVDEFQDTNPIQSRLFQLLTAGKPGSLFIVGDEKQAIYRFRGGDVDNFQSVEERFSRESGGGVYQLTKNFRSSAPLCEWFQEVFSQQRFFEERFPIIERADKQNHYAEVAEEAWDGVYRYPVILPKKGTAYGPGIPGNEEKQVLSLMEGLLGKPVSCYDGESGKMKTKPLCLEDILVVTSKKKKLDSYIQLFREREIPYQVAGKSNLESSSCLQMVTRLLAYLANPDDSRLLGELMWMEPYSLSEKEMVQWNQGHGSDYALAVEEEIRRLGEGLQEATPSAIFRKCMEQMKVSYMTEAFSMNEEPDTMYYALELVRQAEEDGKVQDLPQLVEYLQEGLLSGDLEYELSLTGKPKGVRLMNLHKTKGLEAPVVILADGQAPATLTEPEKQYDYERGSIRWFHIPDRRPGDVPMGKLVETGLFSREKMEEEKKLREEEQRLLYVAATRAENILVIPEVYQNVGDGKKDPLMPVAGERKIGRWEDLLTEGLENLQQKLQPFMDGKKPVPIKNASPPAKAPEDEDWLPFPSLEREAKEQALLPSQVTSKGTALIQGREGPEWQEMDSGQPTLSMGDMLEDAEALGRWKRESTLLGTLVHHLMEALVSHLPESPKESHFRIVIDNILRFHGVTVEEESDYREALMGVYYTMISGGYSQRWAHPHSAFPDDLLRELKKAEEIYTELPFSYYIPKGSPLMEVLGEELELDQEKDSYVNGVMDLVFRDHRGFVILDYKTNRSNENLWSHYGPQLLLYQKVLKEMLQLKEDPRIYLYHIPARKEED